MESIFLLGEAQRAAFFRHIMHSFPSTYICLWSYSPLPANCLLFLDGFYDQEKIQQPSSSSGSLATRLFNAYCGSVNYVDNECLPGLAFKNNVPYLEVKVDYLQTTMLTTQEQMQFYQEAGIKTAVFMCCATGEIELGFSTEPPANLQLEIQSWLSVNFPEQIPSSSSVDSTKYLPSFLDIPSSTCSITISTTTNHHSLIQQFPQVTSAHQILPAFTRYEAPIAAAAAPPPLFRNPTSLFTRSLSFFRNLNMIRKSNRPPQMRHAIAERRRREKQNKSFQILRTLLPQVSKKDKASVLSRTAEYLSSLRSQIRELRRRNDILEMQLSTALREELGGGSSSTQRVIVEMQAHVTPSTSQARFLDLRISLRSRECSLSDLVARILEFLKHHTNLLRLLSLQSNTTFVDSVPLHGLLLRLKPEGDGFDESGFQEAVRRVVDDLPH